MANLTVQSVDTDGLNPALVAAAGGGDTITPADAGPHFLEVVNGGGSPITVTIDDPTSTDPGAASAFNPDVAVSVTNGQRRLIKIDVGRYKNPSTGLVGISYSAVTSVTVGAFKVA